MPYAPPVHIDQRSLISEYNRCDTELRQRSSFYRNGPLICIASFAIILVAVVATFFAASSSDTSPITWSIIIGVGLTATFVATLTVARKPTETVFHAARRVAFWLIICGGLPLLAFILSSLF